MTKMMAFMFAVLALLSACSGADSFEYDEEGDVIQELQQPLITQVSSTNESQCNMITGSMWESAPLGGLTYGAMSCMTSDKTVYIPRTNQVVLKPVNVSCTTAVYNSVLAQLDLIIAELNTAASLGAAGNPQTGGWVFSRSSTGTHPFQCTSLATSPVGANSIRNFVRVVPTASSTFISDQGSTMDGAWYSGWDKLTIQVDGNDIALYAGTATQEQRVYWHAIAHGVIKLTGTGEYAGVRMAASDTTVDQNATGRVMFSLGERCRARNFSFTQQQNVFWSTVAGCANN
jgi:hypothetical protein